MKTFRIEFSQIESQDYYVIIKANTKEDALDAFNKDGYILEWKEIKNSYTGLGIENIEIIEVIENEDRR